MFSNRILYSLKEDAFNLWLIKESLLGKPSPAAAHWEANEKQLNSIQLNRFEKWYLAWWLMPHKVLVPLLFFPLLLSLAALALACSPFLALTALIRYLNGDGTEGIARDMVRFTLVALSILFIPIIAVSTALGMVVVALGTFLLPFAYFLQNDSQQEPKDLDQSSQYSDSKLFEKTGTELGFGVPLIVFGIVLIALSLFFVLSATHVFGTVMLAGVVLTGPLAIGLAVACAVLGV